MNNKKVSRLISIVLAVVILIVSMPSVINNVIGISSAAESRRGLSIQVLGYDKCPDILWFNKIGKKTKLYAQKNGISDNVTWASSNNAVVSVDNDGMLTTKGNGMAKITVRTYNTSTLYDTVIFTASLDVKVILYGDANNDNKVDVNDALMVSRVANGQIENISSDEEERMDVDGVAGITEGDAIYIKKYCLKEITKFPVESELRAIMIVQEASKKQYVKNEPINISGLKVEALYNDGTHFFVYNDDIHFIPESNGGTHLSVKIETHVLGEQEALISYYEYNDVIIYESEEKYSLSKKYISKSASYTINVVDSDTATPSQSTEIPSKPTPTPTQPNICSTQPPTPTPSVSSNMAYTVSYDANGGSGAPSSQTKYKGVNLTISNKLPEREGYRFWGWANSKYSTTVLYAPGSTYKEDEDITLYAVWEKEGGISSNDTPTVSPSKIPTPTPTATPTPTPTVTPTKTPTVKPSSSSTPKPSTAPTVKPTITPSANPSADTGSKSSQSITAKSITKTYGSKPFDLGAYTDGDGEISYNTSNKKIIDINKSGKFVIKGYGKAAIKIIASETDNYMSATKNITITVIPKTVAIKKVVSSKKEFLCTWKKDKTVTGYQIKLNGSGVNMNANLPMAKSSIKVKGKKGKKYSFKIRAYKTVGKKKYYGNWSKTKTVKIK